MQRSRAQVRAARGQLTPGASLDHELGVGIQPLTPEIATSMGIENVKGILINSVTPGSPAERAGLKVGDVITAVEGQKVSDSNALRNRIASAGPGAEVNITIYRDGREQQQRIRLAELNVSRQGDEGGGGPGRGQGTGARLGISVEPLTPQAAQQLRLNISEGLLVRDIDPGGAAADAGIAEGDVIVQVNRQAVKSPADLASAIRDSGAKPVLLLINRGGQTFFITVRPRAEQQ